MAARACAFPSPPVAKRPPALSCATAARRYGYLNRCAHVPIELGLRAEGEFFESSGLYLMCSTHGAIYVPESGLCAGGPCKGGRLRPIPVSERDGQLYWQPDEYVQPLPA